MAEDTGTYHHGDLRTAIEQIAWQAVSEKGAGQLSLRACARAAKVDPAAVYRHFKSKDDILAALTRRAFGELSATLEDAELRTGSQSSEETLLAIGLAYVDYATSTPNVFAMMFEVAGRLPMQDLECTAKTKRKAYQILQDALFRWQPDFSPQDVEKYSYTLWSAVHGLSFLFNAGLGPPSSAEQATRALEVCKAVLKGCLQN